MSTYPNAEGGMTVGELAQMIGFQILKTPSICSLMGWEGPAGARPYLHGNRLDSVVFVDFIDWTRGDKAAGERLRSFANEVGLDMASLQQMTFGPLAEKAGLS
jgi:hypothetical protein